MNTVLATPVFDRLADVLARELDLLQSGRAADAAALIDEKMAALQEFETAVQRGDLPGTTVQRARMTEIIVQMAEENAAHMIAVRNGLRRAISRLESLGSSASVGSYGRGGAQMSFTNATGTYNRKA